MAQRHEDHPFIAIWETTQACDLACKHCRASARPGRHAEELTRAEGYALLQRFRDAGVPLVILTGGDPAKRPDLVELVRFGQQIGLNMGLTPSTTPLVTGSLIEELADAGLSRLAVSIDGATAEVHDAFRGVDGSFAHSLRILQQAASAGIRTQINTSVHSGLIHALPGIVELVEQSGALLWSVFFLVPTGRAELAMLPSADDCEVALNQLAEIAERAPFAVKTTAAPHYRRVLLQRQKARGHGPRHGVHGKSGFRVNDGRGFLFVSHLGEIYPSGFLPVSCGNVRTHDVMDVYRLHPTFRSLRNAEQLGGRCGACEYHEVCGGSRARAYSVYGDFMAEDPLCAHVPSGYVAPAPRRHLAVVES